jgi:bifunctional UDP-N-acetylglucosamine pyrophosphorylase / glucosamine-1-phosphate N-acetyltransferase
MPRPPLSAIVLAAGDGTRMRSSRPKPLHVLCGKAMVVYVLDSLFEGGVSRAVVVVGAGAERVTKKLQEDGPDLHTDFVEQRFARGTGDAASVGLTAFADDDLDDEHVVIVPGDTPLLRAATIAAFAEAHIHSGAAATVLTARPVDPSGQARIIRGKGDRLVRIDERSEEVDGEGSTGEIGTGVYCFRRSLLAPALRRVDPRATGGVHLLSDVIRVLSDAGHPVGTFEVGDATEVLGVNDRVQLARVESELRRRTNLEWLARGVTFVDPEHTYLDTTVKLAADVTLFPGTILQGRTVVGQGAEIGPNARLVDCAVGAGARVENTVGRDAEIGPSAVVGPYAVLDPGAAVAAGAVTGAFYTSSSRDD